MYFLPWSITHNVRELSGFFKDLRGTCLTRRLIALSLPGPDTLDAGIISRRWRSIERSSLEGSVSNSYSQLLIQIFKMLLYNESNFMCSQVQTKTIWKSKLTRKYSFIFPSDLSFHALCQRFKHHLQQVAGSQRHSGGSWSHYCAQLLHPQLIHYGHSLGIK